MHGIPEWLRNLVDHRRRNVELTAWIGLHLIAQGWVGRALLHHFILEHHDAVHQSFGPRWTAGHIHVHRDDGVDTLHHRVVVEHATARRAGTHRDAPLRLRHLLPDAAQHRRELERHAAGADQDVCLTRGEALQLHADTRQIITTRGSRHALDRATRYAEGH